MAWSAMETKQGKNPYRNYAAMRAARRSPRVTGLECYSNLDMKDSER